MIGTSQDLEETLISPSLIPRVGAQPVLNSILDTPTKDLDGVTTQLVSGNVLVNTTLVVKEIFIYGESTLNWTVGGNFGHDLLFVGRDGISRSGSDFVGVVFPL